MALPTLIGSLLERSPSTCDKITLSGPRGRCLSSCVCIANTKSSLCKTFVCREHQSSNHLIHGTQVDPSHLLLVSHNSLFCRSNSISAEDQSEDGNDIQTLSCTGIL